MQLSELTWSGIVAIILAVAIFGGWDIWLQTRNTRPVYMPIQMLVGGVRTPEFRVNLTGPYTIEVEARKRIQFQTLNCLLGMSDMPGYKCNVAPVLKSRMGSAQR
jgi:hypothetical protein